ncbi:MAG TPA: hypothetical protein VFZ34_04990, partial [Blastocatellia bacterium]|nr:hypothetical protein [Blastocatellia bacterium]
MFGVAITLYETSLKCSIFARARYIQEVLGKSAWIHLEAGGEDKWCQAEGDEVLRLLHLLAQAGVNPDLYIITPFVIVADRL